jgi:hypothetical protein
MNQSGKRRYTKQELLKIVKARWRYSLINTETYC